MNSKLLIIIILFLMTLSSFGCSKSEDAPEKQGNVRASRTKATTSSSQAPAGVSEETINEALALLGSSEATEKAKGVKKIYEIGDPALQPLLDFFSSNAPWVRDYFFRLDAEQIEKEWENPAGYMAEIYTKSNYQLPSTISSSGVLESTTNESLQSYVSMRVARFKDVNSDQPNIIVRALKEYENLDVDEVYIDIKVVSDEEAQLKNFLVVGSGKDTRTGDNVRFRIIIKGDGTSTFETVAHKV